VEVSVIVIPVTNVFRRISIPDASISKETESELTSNKVTVTAPLDSENKIAVALFEGKSLKYTSWEPLAGTVDRARFINTETSRDGAMRTISFRSTSVE
jgi:hypothetical protein